jgi:hypothetical protein
MAERGLYAAVKKLCQEALDIVEALDDEEGGKDDGQPHQQLLSSGEESAFESRRKQALALALNFWHKTTSDAVRAYGFVGEQVGAVQSDVAWIFKPHSLRSRPAAEMAPIDLRLVAWRRLKPLVPSNFYLDIKTVKLAMRGPNDETDGDYEEFPLHLKLVFVPTD